MRRRGVAFVVANNAGARSGWLIEDWIGGSREALEEGQPILQKNGRVCRFENILEIGDNEVGARLSRAVRGGSRNLGLPLPTALLNSPQKPSA